MAAPTLTHIDPDGNPRMVDTSEKASTLRTAVAEGWIRMSAEALEVVASGRAAKGDVLQIARIAGIAGAKRTSDLIPLCHPLPLDSVAVDVVATPEGVRVTATVKTVWRTGVEMEALTAVAAALLTVYDTVKAIDRGMRIDSVRLLEKHGGRSGSWRGDSP
jgi:cyclic pyranopterin monophosphate synthase